MADAACARYDATPNKLNLLSSLRDYQTAWLTSDLLAGLMLAAIALPEQLATARLAGFPVEAGLYAFAAGSIAFAVLGTNRFVSVGADSTTAPIFAASLGALFAAGGADYYQHAAVLALFVGAMLVIVGVIRAGWIADLLSVPVRTGILAGISIHIIIGQLPSLLGIASPAGTLLIRLVNIAARWDRANPFTCALGIGVLGLTLLCARVSERIPGALLGLIAAGALVASFGLRARGVAVVGGLSASVPHLQFPPLDDAGHLGTIAPLAVVVAAVCALQTSLVVRSFPSELDGADGMGSDFAAIGVGNILAGLFGAFPVNASPPRTAVVQSGGGRSQLSGIIAVAALAAVLAFFSGSTTYVPQAALAGVLIFIGLRLLRIRDMVSIARCSRREINLVIAAALLVIVLPFQTGMLLAIMLSLIHGVSLVMWPRTMQLFQIRGSTVWWPPTGEHDVVDVPGVLVFAPAAPVNFTNADYIRRQLLNLVAQARGPLKLLVIEASGMADVDYTGSQMLQATIGALRSKGIEVGLARLIGQYAQDAAARSGLIAAFGEEQIFFSVQEAIAGLSQRAGISPQVGDPTGPNERKQ